jgi:S1-C subfamily serine protease
VIVASAQNEQALGSGFIIGQNRIVTNHHVVQGMSEAFVFFSDGKVLPVSEVIYDSAEQDLIILGVETGRRRPVTLGDELSLRQGDSVYAIGAPKGLELSFTNGIVSAFRRADAQFLIQTTAPIAPGSSGGPLLDRAGRVVGVTTVRRVYHHSET